MVQKLRTENNKDLVLKSLNYFKEVNIINNHYEMKKDDAKIALKKCLEEKKIRKITVYWLCQLYLDYGLIVKRENRSVIYFKKERFEEIVKNPETISNKAKNTVIVNQNKTLNIAAKSKKETTQVVDKCYICNKNFSNVTSFENHMNNDLHKKLKIILENTLASIKLEIVISNKVINNDVIVIKKNNIPDVKLRVINATTNDCTISKIITLKQSLIIDNAQSFPIILKKNDEIDIQMQLVVGAARTICELASVLYKLPNDNSTSISKNMNFIINTDAFYDEFHATIKYKPKNKGQLKEFNKIVPGVPLKYDSKRPLMKKKLASYEIPRFINILINKGLKQFDGMTKSHKKNLKRILDMLNVENRKYCLSIDNYEELLTFFIYLEEHQLSINIRAYDAETNALKSSRKGFYELEVPGLAEQRPSIILGDSVYISEKKQNIMYEGIVHAIRECKVELGFHDDFQKLYLPNKNFYVCFSYNRYPIRIEHQGVNLVTSKIRNRLFPKPISDSKEYSQHNLKLFNKNIGNNEQQMQAVQCIFQNTSKNYPYLIYGPPGTGKTSTMVEAIKQIHKAEPQSKIIVCASSNDAVNVITDKLINTIHKTDLLRYLSYSYNINNLPNNMLKYANIDRNYIYQPELRELLKFRIITTTLVNAGRLVNLGAKNHFTCVFIDECGHGTETESLIPISGLLVDEGQIVLAGDHKQLGPIIHSPIAKEFGFGVSMLERLMNSYIYKKDDDGKYNPRYVTKLLNNYRSHHTILKVPNILFYDNELICKGDDLINIGTGFQYLKNKKFPVIFHHIVGKDQREGSSPSFFNVNELEIVDTYLGMLLGSKLSGRKIIGNDIGIISPYRRQVQKLDRLCAKRNYQNVSVGSVEQFQGKEKLIIIISTVRSQSGLLKFDYKFHLGFLSNPKRFNVAVTRAKTLLIIIGNGNLLQLDPSFYEFIKYCKDNDGIYGENLDIGEPPTPNIEQNQVAIENIDLLQAEPDVDFKRGNV